MKIQSPIKAISYLSTQNEANSQFDEIHFKLAKACKFNSIERFVSNTLVITKIRSFKKSQSFDTSVRPKQKFRQYFGSDSVGLANFKGFGRNTFNKIIAKFRVKITMRSLKYLRFCSELPKLSFSTHTN